jgi:hypothetical protein
VKHNSKGHELKPRVPKTHKTKLPVPKIQATKPLPPRTLTVSEWFNKYDQIRRDAEMTMADKWQSMLLQARKPEQKNAALATRMSAKYGRALFEMKKLGSTPETKALQVGYIEYFATARQLFEDYLVAQKAVPFSNKSLVPTKKKLEVLDKKTKELMRRFGKNSLSKNTDTAESKGKQCEYSFIPNGLSGESIVEINAMNTCDGCN